MSLLTVEDVIVKFRLIVSFYILLILVILDRLLMCFNLYLRHHTPTEHDIEKCPRCEEARIMRRILARWLNLAGVLTFRDVSQCVKDRFPTLDHIKSAGFLTLPELELYENTKTVHLKYWIPFIWFTRNVHTSF